MGMITNYDQQINNQFVWFTGYSSKHKFIIKKEDIDKITVSDEFDDRCVIHMKKYPIEISEDISTCIQRLGL